MVFLPEEISLFLYLNLKVKYSQTFSVIETLTYPSAVQDCIVSDTAQPQGGSLG